MRSYVSALATYLVLVVVFALFTGYSAILFFLHAQSVPAFTTSTEALLYLNTATMTAALDTLAIFFIVFVTIAAKLSWLRVVDTFSLILAAIPVFLLIVLALLAAFERRLIMLGTLDISTNYTAEQFLAYSQAPAFIRIVVKAIYIALGVAYAILLIHYVGEIMTTVGKLRILVKKQVPQRK